MVLVRCQWLPFNHLCYVTDDLYSIPETKRVTLEEMDTLFGGSNHIEKGGDLLHVEDTHHVNLEVGHNAINMNDHICEGRANYGCVAEIK